MIVVEDIVWSWALAYRVARSLADKTGYRFFVCKTSAGWGYGIKQTWTGEYEQYETWHVR